MEYVAIDFQTANRLRRSACSIALVSVKDGKIAALSARIFCISTKKILPCMVSPKIWLRVSRIFMSCGR